MTLDEYIHTTLRDDATMHTLLGKVSTPYGIYREFAPETPDFPLITWEYLTSSEDIVETRRVVFTIYAKDVEPIMKRIRDLFQNKQQCLDDYGFRRMTKTNTIFGDFSDDFKIPSRKVEYTIYLIPKTY
jgi:hypothetical protein